MSRKRIPYIRVASQYFQVKPIILPNGKKTEILLDCDIESIISDHGEEYAGRIPRYDNDILDLWMGKNSKKFPENKEV